MHRWLPSALALATLLVGCPGNDGDGLDDAAVDAAPSDGAVPTRVRLMTWNVRNFFDDVDDPDTNDDVATPEELADKVRDLGAVIGRFDPDFVALQEVEANSRVLDALVAGPLAAGGYTRFEAGRNADPRGIDVAFVSRVPVTSVVTTAGARFPNPDGGTTRFTRDLLQLRLNAGGNDVWVLIAHFLSQRNPENDGRRLAEATAAGDVAQRLVASGNARVLLLGDVNDVPGSPAYGALTGAGLEDLTLSVPDEARFTFVFRGERTQLDHALATPELARGLAGISIVNDPDTERASDHAPIVLDLNVLP